MPKKAPKPVATPAAPAALPAALSLAFDRGDFYQARRLARQLAADPGTGAAQRTAALALHQRLGIDPIVWVLGATAAVANALAWWWVLQPITT